MANSPASQERPVSQMVDECRYVAHELEVYGAEDEPQVNVHKKLFRLAAALIRRNADALRASEERIAGLTGELEKNREVSIAASEQVLNLSTERVAWRKREQRLRALCEEYRDLAGFADIIRKFRAAITRNDSTQAERSRSNA